MARNQENTGFICKNCKAEVPPVTNGSYRNHCPFCLYSVHLDVIPGDRASDCQGLMKPIGITHKSKKGWQIIHKCELCGTEMVCKVATDSDVPDDYMAIASLNREKIGST